MVAAMAMAIVAHWWKWCAHNLEEMEAKLWVQGFGKRLTKEGKLDDGGSSVDDGEDDKIPATSYGKDEMEWGERFMGLENMG